MKFTFNDLTIARRQLDKLVFAKMEDGGSPELSHQIMLGRDKVATIEHYMREAKMSTAEDI